MKPFIIRASGANPLWAVNYLSRSLGSPRTWNLRSWDEAWRWLERAYRAGDVYRRAEQ